MSSSVLVTGAAGFIGSHLCESLLAGEPAERCTVIGLDNFSDFYPRPRKQANVAEVERAARSRGAAFNLVEADIRDRAAVDRLFAEHQPERVVHLAAMAGVRPSIENPALYTSVNVDGTVNLLDAAVRQRCRAFIFASSSSVYGNSRKVPFAEDDRVDFPISPYAATKKAGELVAHTYHHVHALPVTCLRFFTVFGPRQRPDLAIAKFLRLVAAGEMLPMFGDGSSSRDYTYVADIIAGVRAALERCERERDYRIFNLGGNRPVTLRDLIATIERVTGKTARIDRQPTQIGDVERTWADLARSQAELGYSPRTSLEEGIAAQWRWQQQA